jgi:hypothetical protein
VGGGGTKLGEGGKAFLHQELLWMSFGCRRVGSMSFAVDQLLVDELLVDELSVNGLSPHLIFFK